MKRKSVMDRYTYSQMKAFEAAFVEAKRHTDWTHAACCAAVGTLISNSDWNGTSGGAYFDDVLALAGRSEYGHLLLPE